MTRSIDSDAGRAEMIDADDLDAVTPTRHHDVRVVTKRPMTTLYVIDDLKTMLDVGVEDSMSSIEDIPMGRSAARTAYEQLTVIHEAIESFVSMARIKPGSDVDKKAFALGEALSALSRAWYAR